MKILEKISNWIDNQIPQSVKVPECVIRELVAVHSLEINSGVSFFIKKEQNAIDRLTSQMEYSGVVRTRYTPISYTKKIRQQ